MGMTGSYEIENITNYLQKLETLHNIEVNIKANKNTLWNEIKCNFDIDLGIAMYLTYQLPF